MKEKILQFLKTNAKLAGVQDSYLLGVAELYSKTVTEESQIATMFSDGVVDLIKISADTLQKEGDRRATEASKTALKTFQEKHNLDESGKPKQAAADSNYKPVNPEDSTIPEWAKKILSDNAELKSRLENQDKEKSSAILSERVMKHEKLKDIPQSFLKGRNLVPQSEAEIDQLVASIESDYNGFKQEMTEKGVIVSIPPTGGGALGEKVSIDTYLDEKFPKQEPNK